jgi:hypothetical protein
LGKKIRDYEKDLWGLFWSYSKSGDFGEIRTYLLQRSGLPGPRGNLELATAFGNVIQRGTASGSLDSKDLLSLCQSLCQIPAELAPTNDPNEFLVFCGACGLGALGGTAESFYSVASSLRSLASDTRWRTREGVAMALQRMIDAEPKQTLMLLSQWVEANDPLVLRAVVAGVAEPRLFRNGEVTRSAMRLHRRVFERIPGLDHEADDFKSLKKSLGYSLSVVVAYSPKEGFALMEELARSKDRNVSWIVRENLTKKRLMKYSHEVDVVKRLMSVK